MCVIVNDASGLIDLRKGGLLNPVCDLPYRFIVPLPVRASEVLDVSSREWRDLDDRGWITHDLTPDEVAAALAEKIRYPGLSANDCFCLVIALAHRGILLTGDALLRRVATAGGFAYTACFGSWINWMRPDAAPNPCWSGRWKRGGTTRRSFCQHSRSPDGWSHSLRGRNALPPGPGDGCGGVCRSGVSGFPLARGVARSRRARRPGVGRVPGEPAGHRLHGDQALTKGRAGSRHHRSRRRKPVASIIRRSCAVRIWNISPSSMP